MKKAKKLTIGAETIRTLASGELARVAGAVDENTAGFTICCNTVRVCVDTQAVTNCYCTGQSFNCPTVGCTAAPI